MVVVVPCLVLRGILRGDGGDDHIVWVWEHATLGKGANTTQSRIERREEHTMKSKHHHKTHHHGPPASEAGERAFAGEQGLGGHRTKGEDPGENSRPWC